MLRKNLIYLGLLTASLRAENPPAEWRRSLDYDIRYNQRRSEDFNNFPSSVPRQIYEVLVPLDSNEYILGEEAPPQLLRLFTRRRGGESYLRVPFVDPAFLYPVGHLDRAAEIEFSKMRADLEETRGPLRPTGRWVRKKTSKNTYFIYSLYEKTFGDYEIKIQFPFQRIDDQWQWANSSSQLGRAIRQSNLIQKLHRGHEDAYTFYPELFMANPVILRSALRNHRYAFSLRKIPPRFRPDPAAGIDAFSLHSLLGNPRLIERLAHAAGLSSLVWLQKVYLPQLARFVATSNFDEGIIYADHAQNLCVRADYNTGQIELGVKDASDVSFDPAIVLENLDLMTSGQRIYSHDLHFLNHNSADSSGEEYAIYEEHRRGYLSDVIILPKASYRSQKVLSETFLALLEAEVAARIGHPLPSRDHLAALRSNLGANLMKTLQGQRRDADFPAHLENSFVQAMRVIRLDYLAAHWLGRGRLFSFAGAAAKQRVADYAYAMFSNGRMIFTDSELKSPHLLQGKFRGYSEGGRHDFFTDRKNIYVLSEVGGHLIAIVPLGAEIPAFNPEDLRPVDWKNGAACEVGAAPTARR